MDFLESWYTGIYMGQLNNIMHDTGTFLFFSLLEVVMVKIREEL